MTGSGQSIPANRVQAHQDSRDAGLAAAAAERGNAAQKPVDTTLKIEVTRDTETCNSTTGTFKASAAGASVGSVTGFTLEPPSAQKATSPEQKKNPRIPAGTYTAKTYISQNKGKPVHRYRVFLLDVPGRKWIEMHVGNYPRDTEGCILPGGSRGKDFVGQSLEKMGDLLKLYDDAKKANGDKDPKIQVEIKENFPK